ncbi:MAG: Vgb family protein [Nitrososphaerales archaeon]
MSRVHTFIRFSVLFLLLVLEISSGSSAISAVPSSVSASAAASSFTPTLSINRTVVPTPYVKEFNVSTPNPGLSGLAIDPSGNVWFIEDNASRVGVFFPSNDSFREYPFLALAHINHAQQSVNLSSIALVALSQIAYDVNSGKLWFTWAASNSIGELDPSTGQTKFYQVPTQGAGPFDILISPNDTIWFSEILGNKIGRLDPASESIEEFDTPTSFSGPGMMTFDSHGRIWFAETYAKKIGVLDPALAQPGTSNGVQEYTPPYAVFSPLGIAFSGDAFWFTDHGANSFSEFIPQNSTWRQFWVNLPIGVSFGGIPIVQSLPAQILIDKNGNVWLAEHQGNRIAGFDPSNGILTEYLVPTRPLTETLWLALDQNGNAWFTEHDTGKIGVVNASKAVPFNISVSDSVISLRQGSTASAEVSVSSTNPSAALGTLNFTMSGLSTFGLENMTYSFNPSEYSSSSGSSALSNFTINAMNNLDPGNYTVFIGASNSQIITSKVVTLIVTSSSQSPLSQLYGYSLILIVAVIVVALSVFILFIFRRRKHT